MKRVLLLLLLTASARAQLPQARLDRLFPLGTLSWANWRSLLPQAIDRNVADGTGEAGSVGLSSGFPNMIGD